MAENVAHSLRKGGRVAVSGRLDHSAAGRTPRGDKRSKIEVTADEVAPSLRRATGTVTKNERSARDRPTPGPDPPKRRAALTTTPRATSPSETSRWRWRRAKPASGPAVPPNPVVGALTHEILDVLRTKWRRRPRRSDADGSRRRRARNGWSGRLAAGDARCLCGPRQGVLDVEPVQGVGADEGPEGVGGAEPAPSGSVMATPSFRRASARG